MRKVLYVILLLVLSTSFICCFDNMLKADEADIYEETIDEIYYEENIDEDIENQQQEKHNPDVLFGDYKIIGSQSIILSFIIDENLDFDIKDIEVVIFDKQNGNEIKVKPEIYENIYYARVDGLKENTYYDVNIFDNTVQLVSDFSFSTPKRTITMDEVQSKINQELEGFNYYNDEESLLYQTQACLSLMGFEIGSFGRFKDIAQSNLCIFEYSVNKLNDYVYYENIVAHPNEKTLDTLKDILAVDINISKEDIVQDFIPNKYKLSEYAIIDDEGGKLDIENYILDQLENYNELSDICNKYPFIIYTTQFKENYSEYFIGDEYDIQHKQKLQQYAAKNKALFSYYAKDILKELAKPQQRLIYFYNEDACVTVDTMIAFSYMFMDAYEETGLHFEISTAYRDYDFQWLLYSQKNGMSVAKERNANWHYNRQKLSYVPGFSNHQYGVSIDFHERTTFGQTKLYKYLLEHGNDYGFYNYYIEPWHWSYLGKLDQYN